MEKRVTAARAPAVSSRSRTIIAVAATLLVAIGAVSLYVLRSPAQTAIAVVLFDNETGKSEYDQLAQQLTDAAVLKLTARTSLAVIGNAAVLRTSRPFRDIAAIRDALHVSYIVIGQVQEVDGVIRSQAHLIRTVDQAHLWVDRVPLKAGAAAIQSEMAEKIDSAVAAKVIGISVPRTK